MLVQKQVFERKIGKMYIKMLFYVSKGHVL